MGEQPAVEPQLGGHSCSLGGLEGPESHTHTHVHVHCCVQMWSLCSLQM